jgi:hypothetical protein
LTPARGLCCLVKRCTRLCHCGRCHLRRRQSLLRGQLASEVPHCGDERSHWEASRSLIRWCSRRTCRKWVALPRRPCATLTPGMPGGTGPPCRGGRHPVGLKSPRRQASQARDVHSSIRCCQRWGPRPPWSSAASCWLRSRAGRPHSGDDAGVCDAQQAMPRVCETTWKWPQCELRNSDGSVFMQVIGGFGTP